MRTILDFTITQNEEESKEVVKILHFKRQDMRGILLLNNKRMQKNRAFIALMRNERLYDKGSIGYHRNDCNHNVGDGRADPMDI